MPVGMSVHFVKQTSHTIERFVMELCWPRCIIKFHNNLVPVFRQIIHFRRSIIGRRAERLISGFTRRGTGTEKRDANKKNIRKEDGETDIWPTACIVAYFIRDILYRNLANSIPIFRIRSGIAPSEFLPLQQPHNRSTLTLFFAINSSFQLLILMFFCPPNDTLFYFVKKHKLL